MRGAPWVAVLVLAGSLGPLPAPAPPRDAGAAFDAAEAAFEDRARVALAEDPTLAPLVDVQRANFALAGALLAKLEEPHGDALGHAVALAQLATRRLAGEGEAALFDAPPPARHVTPSAALLTLAALHDAPVTRADAGRVAALDALPGDVPQALARLVDAFLAFDAAARAASLVEAYDPWFVYAARNHLLDAMLDLRDALEARDALEGASWAAACGPLVVAPAFALSLDPDCDDTYTQDVALLIDWGGHDTYLNNAGGNNFLGGTCPLETPTAPHAVAALVDYRGDDNYTSGRRCGQNGGARAQGAGFLLDAAGNDEYQAGGSGSNGGASLTKTIGFLLDAGGNDSYRAEGRAGVNGGGHQGRGFLLDYAGDDAYVGWDPFDFFGWSLGANGGAALAGGVGFLLDGAGNDAYTGGFYGAQGGAHGGARGFLLDAGGDDAYARVMLDSLGANGGATAGSAGFLLDRGGNDSYAAGSWSGNGGASGAAVGTLADLGGHDAYAARWENPNGAASGGLGLLYDHAGHDWYEDLEWGTGWDRTILPKGLAGAQVDRAEN